MWCPGDRAEKYSEAVVSCVDLKLCYCGDQTWLSVPRPPGLNVLQASKPGGFLVPGHVIGYVVLR